ncbi:hypothetical protein EDD73_103136 [Heliophilum fasciatum]|uniref:Uncharacterized protein n=1 Tax=Heliophilum fasciatum TaxID=35700 RepID=A0A4R2RYA5_9FIRM|nr:hypothetical protein [Heliophilum fasciatum]TCP68504.1 hypothetical protein EDD73_103136 [Heliophilum fasciatum]
MLRMIARLLPYGVRGFLMYTGARMGIRWALRNRHLLR